MEGRALLPANGQVPGPEPTGRSPSASTSRSCVSSRSSHSAPKWRGNKLVVDFADPGSIHAHFLAKEPGPRMHLDSAEMTFRYKDSFQTANNLEAYEHLILEAMLGNRSLFTRSDGIERLWEVAAPLLEIPPPVGALRQGLVGARVDQSRHRAQPVVPAPIASSPAAARNKV